MLVCACWAHRVVCVCQRFCSSSLQFSWDGEIPCIDISRADLGSKLVAVTWAPCCHFSNWKSRGGGAASSRGCALSEIALKLAMAATKEEESASEAESAEAPPQDCASSRAGSRVVTANP